jgi:branched-chain amino acid transport system ATP-binding protein
VKAGTKTGTRFWRALGSKAEVVDEATALALQFGLADVLNAPTSSLPYGKQRLLEIAVAIACRPRVLLLDEPAAGVPGDERHEILAAVAALPTDVTVLLIEHDMDIGSFADRTVLVNGVLVEGSPRRSCTIPASSRLSA